MYQIADGSTGETLLYHSSKRKVAIEARYYARKGHVVIMKGPGTHRQYSPDLSKRRRAYRIPCECGDWKAVFKGRVCRRCWRPSDRHRTSAQITGMLNRK